MMGRSFLDYGKIESLDTVIKAIEKVNANDLQTLANEFLHEKNLTSLTYLPE